MGYKLILKLDPTISSSIKERVGNHIKYSDWVHILKVKDRDRNNSDSQKAPRWNIEIKWMMSQYQKGTYHDSECNKIPILTNDWAKINKD